jgi:hypothetical protein
VEAWRVRNVNGGWGGRSVGGLVLPERQRRLGREQLGDDRGGVAALDTPVARRPDYTPDAPESSVHNVPNPGRRDHLGRISVPDTLRWPTSFLAGSILHVLHAEFRCDAEPKGSRATASTGSVSRRPPRGPVPRRALGPCHTDRQGCRSPSPAAVDAPHRHRPPTAAPPASAPRYGPHGRGLRTAHSRKACRPSAFRQPPGGTVAAGSLGPHVGGRAVLGAGADRGDDLGRHVGALAV